jgi:hypothetical protein
MEDGEEYKEEQIGGAGTRKKMSKLLNIKEIK